MEYGEVVYITIIKWPQEPFIAASFEVINNNYCMESKTFSFLMILPRIGSALYTITPAYWPPCHSLLHFTLWHLIVRIAS